MYSKTRNTLTALIAASLVVAAGWLCGHPVDAQSQVLAPMQASIAEADAQVALVSTALRVHPANRMSLAMPYYSFSVMQSQRRAD